MMWFKRTVNVLFTLSASGVLGEGHGIDSVRLIRSLHLHTQSISSAILTAKPIFTRSRHREIKDVLY